MKFILGIDTSCYTTSIALVNFEKQIILNKQLILNVKKGARGLQQSNAIFQHLHNLPKITKILQETIDTKNIVALCASSKPRPISDSYMPVFMVSHLLGQTISHLLQAPYYEVSHQENHIMAGQYSANGPYQNKFLAIHLSGGTTELLKITDNKNGYDINIIGATQDLHAGQFVDRIGVSMGLTFPAGPHLENLAMKAEEKKSIIPYYVKGLTIGFSGAETHAQRLLEKKTPEQEVAWGVFDCIIRTLEKWIYYATHDKMLNNILLVGGVSSSHLVREHLTKSPILKKNDIRLFFAEPQLSKDNAVGAALLGLKRYRNKNTTL